MQAVGLRTYVWNNLWKSVLLLAGFPLLLMLGAYGLLVIFAASEDAGVIAALREAARLLPAAAPFALAATAAWFAVALLANQRIIDALAGARAITRQAEPRLWNAMEVLCISRGEAMPRLAIIDDPARNAFASGLSRRAGAVTVTRGLLAALDDRELAAVLAHELTHIRNGDARLAVIAAVFAGILSLLPELLFRGPLRAGSVPVRIGRGRGNDRGGGGAAVLIGLALAVLAYVLALALRAALSRNREFLADAGAVELTQDPDAMITALRKVAGDPGMQRLPSSLQAMLLQSPAETLGGAWLATHPAVDQRIAALVRYAGGREPGA